MSRPSLTTPANPAMTANALSRSALTGASLLVALAACHTSGIAPGPRSALDDTAQINRDIATRNRWTVIAGIGGAVLAVAGLGLIFWSP